MHLSPPFFGCRRYAAISTALVFASSMVFAAESPEKKKKEADQNVVQLSPFEVSSSASGYYSANTMSGTRLGATPGGAKDIRYFRSGAGRGEIPHPDTFTPEGLFSEHDLPLDLGEAGEGFFRVQSAAASARFEVLPHVRYLAQVGLDSGLQAATWKPAPLNLVAVIDKSGSMSGEPLALVRASLQHAVGHLREGDKVSIVLYGDRAHVHLAPTAVTRATRRYIREQIDAIESAGSTNMEAGLKVGYELARETKAQFRGNTRVMLFTDERPNVGNTSPESFMAMARAASRDGIGLTTVGVGVQFGAELATQVSSVRGGNLYFFASGDEMKRTFEEEFDTLVTELAHDFSIRIEPARGLRIEGVFGVPGDVLRWDGRAIVMDVATIFLSRRKGGIYFALAADGSERDLPAADFRTSGRIAEVTYRYRGVADSTPTTGMAECRLVRPTAATAGLSRGIALVDEYLTLKRAAQAHLLENNQEAAFQLVNGLRQRLAASSDRHLGSERKLVGEMYKTLAALSGHASEIPEHASANSWRRHSADDAVGSGKPVELDSLSGLPARPSFNHDVAPARDADR